MLLFSTVHGSKLYGLNHASSDNDTFNVVDSAPAGHTKLTYTTHKVEGTEDVTVMDFGTWMLRCHEGSPQALEAMFSGAATVDIVREIPAFFQGG